MKVRPRFPILAILPWIAFASCSEPLPPDLEALQKSKEALQIENGQLREKAAADALRIRTLQEDLRVKTKDWSERSTKMSEESRTRLEKTIQLQAQIEELKIQLEPVLKSRLMDARTEAKGGQIPILKTRDGEIYRNVTIRSVVPDGLHIMHQDGATKVFFSQLDSSWGDRFGYNTKEAEAYAKELSAQKSAAQKAQWETINDRHEKERMELEQDKHAAANRPAQQENQQARQLSALRAELVAELQNVNSSLKSPLSISQSDPENSPAFSNNLVALRLSRARDLRAQINELKSKLGNY